MNLKVSQPQNPDFRSILKTFTNINTMTDRLYRNTEPSDPRVTHLKITVHKVREIFQLYR